MRKTAVILRFNPCSRLCSHLGISLCLFEFCRTVARSVVLLEDFHGSARWDVLPVGKEVNPKPVVNDTAPPALQDLAHVLSGNLEKWRALRSVAKLLD